MEKGRKRKEKKKRGRKKEREIRLWDRLGRVLKSVCPNFNRVFSFLSDKEAVFTIEVAFNVSLTWCECLLLYSGLAFSHLKHTAS